MSVPLFWGPLLLDTIIKITVIYLPSNQILKHRYHREQPLLVLRFSTMFFFTFLDLIISEEILDFKTDIVTKRSALSNSVNEGPS